MFIFDLGKIESVFKNVSVVEIILFVVVGVLSGEIKIKNRYLEDVYIFGVEICFDEEFLFFGDEFDVV